MKRTTISILGMLVTWVIASMSAASAASPHAAQTSAPTETADAKIYGCIRGLEQILPGDYYACRALYHFQRKHYGQAVEMLEEAAHWANKDAQYALGLIYFHGDVPGFPANRPLSIAWLALSAERKDPTYVQTYSLVSVESSPAEIQAANQLWLKMGPEYGDKVAGLRALRRFNHEIAPIEQAADYGGSFYIRDYSPFPENALSIVRDLHARADRDFDGLVGTVTVGALQER